MPYYIQLIWPAIIKLFNYLQRHRVHCGFKFMLYNFRSLNFSFSFLFDKYERKFCRYPNSRTGIQKQVFPLLQENEHSINFSLDSLMTSSLMFDCNTFTTVSVWSTTLLSTTTVAISWPLELNVLHLLRMRCHLRMRWQYQNDCFCTRGLLKSIIII